MTICCARSDSEAKLKHSLAKCAVSPCIAGFQEQANRTLSIILYSLHGNQDYSGFDRWHASQA